MSITQRIVNVSKTREIRIIDYIFIGGNRDVSMENEGCLLSQSSYESIHPQLICEEDHIILMRNLLGYILK